MTLAEALHSSELEPREARLLLSHASGISEAQILALPERELPAPASMAFAEYLQRRKRGEPVAYILGEKEFYGLALEVTPAVLIPRPETELVVERALECAFASVADLGTGSGAIALALKKHRPRSRVVGTDASAAALQVAGRNAARHRLEVEWRQGSWFEPLAGETFDLVVANPPYIAAGDPHLGDLRFEPAPALVSGADGLDAMRDIVAAARRHLRPGGWLLIEHGIGQETAVRSLMTQAGLEEARTWPDLAGIPRVSGARR